MLRVIFISVFLSLCLFGSGEASFLSTKIHYLSNQGSAILNASNDKDERVEVFVSVLDKDGNLASATASGGNLDNITNSHLDSFVDANLFTLNDIDREADRKNTARFVVDYTSVATAQEQDILTLSLGGLEKKIKINFSYSKAKGLVLRTASRAIDPLLFQGRYFSEINVDGDNNLSEQSRSYHGNTAGAAIPIVVYASTQEQDKDPDGGALVEGRFTMSTELDGATVVVKALGDYDADGIADVLIGEVEGEMSRGMVQVKMSMDKGLPENESNIHSRFDRGIFDGLGIAFVAYVKDDPTISNRGQLNHSDLEDPAVFKIAGDHNATDVAIIRSDLASQIKIGQFDRTVKFLDMQWDKPYVNYYVLDDNLSTTEQNITLTAVDKYGNPAVTGVLPSTACSYDAQDYFIIDCKDVFGSNMYGVMTKEIIIRPSNTSSSADTTAYVNTLTQEGKTIEVEMEIAGTGGLASSETLKVNLYAGRVGTNYLTTQNFSTLFTKETVALRRDNGIDRDFKVVVRQTDINATTMKVEVYRGLLNGGYETSSKSSTYDPRFSGSTEAIQGVDMRAGGVIRINDVGDIDVPSFSQSSTLPLDGFTAYFFANADSTESLLDINVVMLAQGYSESNGSKTRVEPGATIRFNLYGIGNRHDYIRVQYGNDDEKAHIGLASAQAITKQSSVYRNVAGDFVDTDLALAIKGYTVRSGTDYFFIEVNGHRIDNDRIVSRAADMVIDEAENRGIFPRIEFEYKREDHEDNTAQINVVEFGVQNRASNDGTTTTSLLELSDLDGEGEDDDGSFFTQTTQEIVYRGEVLANRYYLLFDEDADLQEQDAFGNVLNTENGRRRSLANYEYDVSGRGDVGVNANGDIYIKFENGDAEEERTLSIEADRGINTIRFVNIVASTLENDSYIINPVHTSPQINLVNSEVLLKVIGNNRGVAKDFSLKFAHSDVNAKINIVRVEGAVESFISTLGTSIYDPLDENGNYYLLRTDKPGEITIDAVGNEKDENDRDIIVETTKTLRFVTFDTTKPNVQVDLVGNKITAIVSDGSLDFDRTIVEARNSEGDLVKKSVYQDGKHIISGLDLGTYQIYVYAIDLFDNEFENTYTRVVESLTVPVVVENNVTVAPPIEEEDIQVEPTSDIALLANALVKHAPYPVYGKFISYDFESEDYTDWIFQDALTQKTYKLYGKNSSTDPFGFEEFTPDISTIGQTTWYMLRLDGLEDDIDAKDKFGWIVVSKDWSIVKKLKSINNDGSLSYAPLSVKVRIENELIEFYQ